MTPFRLTCEPGSKIILVTKYDKLIYGVFVKIYNGCIWITDDQVTSHPDMTNYRSSGYNFEHVKTWYYNVDTDLGI